MLPRLFLLFTLVGVVEIIVLVWIAKATSVLFVLSLLIGIGIAGAWLARTPSTGPRADGDEPAAAPRPGPWPHP